MTVQRAVVCVIVLARTKLVGGNVAMPSQLVISLAGLWPYEQVPHIWPMISSRAEIKIFLWVDIVLLGT